MLAKIPGVPQRLNLEVRMRSHTPDTTPWPEPDPHPDPTPDPRPEPTPYRSDPPVRIIDLPPNTPTPGIPVEHS